MTNPHTPTKAGEAASEPDFNEIWRQCLRDAPFSYGPLPQFAETFGRAVIAALAPSPADRAASVGAVPEKFQWSPEQIALLEATLRQHFPNGCTSEREKGLHGLSVLAASSDTSSAIRQAAVEGLLAAALATPQALPTPQAERSDTERLDWLQRDMLSSEPTGIEWSDGAFTFPYLVSSPGGLGAGVGHARFKTLREAIDAAIRTTAAATSEGAK